MHKTEENYQTKKQRIFIEEPLYPDKLRQLRIPPKSLYVWGELPDPTRPAVAVIGTRQCSRYGKEMAEYYSGELAKAGVQIISGMAAGVDGIAQWAALEAGGSSFGVLGCGTDICYPETNRRLYERLQRQGGLISEYPDKTPPRAVHFPPRNRIISGLADLVLVIEAKIKSGTLITVDFALEQGKDVFALPGRLDDILSSGCNRLIHQGAGIALSPDDILESLYGKGWQDMKKKINKKDTGITDTEEVELPDRQRLIWECLGNRAIEFGELFHLITERDESYLAPDVMNLLMEMVMAGLVICEVSGGFLRNRNFKKNSCHSKKFGV